MVFSSLIFLYCFLPLVLLFYYIAPHSLKNTFLLLVSLFFYAWGEPKYVILMFISIILNYFMGLLIERSTTQSWKSLSLFMALLVNLSLLGYYKYGGFIVEIIETVFHLKLEWEAVPLPIGISFYTFQAMSYIIDVYRREVPAQKNPIHLALYISLFPQLVAGPIVRYQQIVDQIRERIVTAQHLVVGTERFVQGLAKKVLIANPMGEVADYIFGLSNGDLTTGTAWLGILAYMLQIYFDFSGYSDMAIGLGKCFGFHFDENFNYPYVSQSVSEFWRRWHISLGSWFRDYVYIPLGGSRVSTVLILRNIIIVWALTGLWHGANWTFIVWGLYFGVFIALERFVLLDFLKKLPRFARHLYLWMIVSYSWVLFRAESYEHIKFYTRTLFHIDGGPLYDYHTILYLTEYIPFYIVGIILLFPIYPYLRKKLEGWTNNLTYRVAIITIIRTILYLFIILWITMYLVNATHNPFIYFRF